MAGQRPNLNTLSTSEPVSSFTTSTSTPNSMGLHTALPSMDPLTCPSSQPTTPAPHTPTFCPTPTTPHPPKPLGSPQWQSLKAEMEECRKEIEGYFNKKYPGGFVVKPLPPLSSFKHDQHAPTNTSQPQPEPSQQSGAQDPPERTAPVEITSRSFKLRISDHIKTLLGVKSKKHHIDREAHFQTTVDSTCAALSLAIPRIRNNMDNLLKQRLIEEEERDRKKGNDDRDDRAKEDEKKEREQLEKEQQEVFAKLSLLVKNFKVHLAEVSHHVHHDPHHAGKKNLVDKLNNKRDGLDTLRFVPALSKMDDATGQFIRTWKEFVAPKWGTTTKWQGW